MSNELITPTPSQKRNHTNGKSENEQPGQTPRNTIPINKALFGMLIFIASEIMFFGGLISAFVILKSGSEGWPPLNQPRLPVEITAFSTIILLLSLLTMRAALGKLRKNESRQFKHFLVVTTFAGLLFLVIQGFEWIQLIDYGLTFTSSIFGATFYLLIGCHGLHILGAMLAMLLVMRKAFQGKYSQNNHSGVAVLNMYWHFVVGIWPILYILVYLT